MIKKPGLGRGLSALIPAARPAESPSAGQHVRLVPLAKLEANRLQPRKHFSDAALSELAESIKVSGILQPILVTRDGDRFRILAGERRYRAASLAGLSEVPVLVREGLENRDHLLLALVENVQREDLTPLEEAEAYHQLRDELGMTQDDIAQRVGKDRATVANTLRLLKLPSDIRLLLAEGQITAGHARAILSLTSLADQETLAKEIVARGLSVRAAEARAAKFSSEPKPEPQAPQKDADTRDAERRLERALSTKVEIRRKGKGGQIRISYFSEQQLIGLFDRLVKDEL
ncbi:MAG: ParB/RepB/Spo0J family partition protein [Thermoanaerobaculia bacterium]|nr:Chromosome-partitioning protein Spo0J [Thermoanaerobaculia bacterium]MCK6683788.1 ParB/RepB/Spo0J family partition protein [Thermoanaerobaculia bacterium]